MRERLFWKSAAAVTCATANPEFTPPSSTRRAEVREIRVHHQGDAALGQRARFRKHQRQVVGGKRYGFRMKVAAGQDLAGVREHERIVGNGIGFGEQHVGHMPPLIETSTHHLRLAAQAVRILHAAAIDV